MPKTVGFSGLRRASRAGTNERVLEGVDEGNPRHALVACWWIGGGTCSLKSRGRWAAWEKSEPRRLPALPYYFEINILMPAHSAPS